MNDSKISVRYAKAFYNLAKEENLLKEVRDDVEMLSELIVSVPELNMFISNPIIKPAKKEAILKEIIGKRIQSITWSFIVLIIRNNRIHYIDSMVRFFLDLYKKNLGIMPASLMTAVPVDDELRHTLLRIIEKKLNIKVELEEKTNANLIGGFILRIGNQQIDASVSNRLAKIRKELINGKS